jgi:two-component system, LytTR family, response regulator
MTPRLRAFLVDDEPLALTRLTRLLERTGRVEIVGRATDPEAALCELPQARADVVFLDIQMPGLSGLELAARVPPGTRVVFTTAYEQHAVAAFEVNAVDYLLKPIAAERLSAALRRLDARRDDPPQAALQEMLARLTRQLQGTTYLAHLASRVGERVQLIAVEEVTHVLARDRATYAVTSAGEHMLDTAIVELERKLDPARFLRIHRSVLVNVACIAELHADFGGRLVIRLRNDRRTELPVARDRVRTLKERLGLAP